MKNQINNLPKNKGMTFIEVLIALVILVTGILGAVAMQATAKQGSFDAMQRSLASALVQDIIERMRSNLSTTTVLSTYEGTYGATALSVPATRCNAAGALCNTTQMTTNDLYEWTQSIRGGDVTSNGINAGGLVNAVGCITETANAVTVAISWQGKTATTDGAASSVYFNTNGSCGTAASTRRQVYVEVFIY